MLRRSDRLTDFQLEALQHASAGRTALATAAALGKRVDNVKSARKAVLRKFGVTSIDDAVEYARGLGYPMAPRAKNEVPPQGWRREWERGGEFIDHWWGRAWYNAPLPKPDHNCLPQTRGIVRVQGLPLMRISRCACGAADWGEGWQERNSRSS